MFPRLLPARFPPPSPDPRPPCSGLLRCPSAGPSVPEGGGDRAGGTGRSLSRGDAPRPPALPSPERVGALRVGGRGGGGSGVPRAGHGGGRTPTVRWDSVGGLVPFAGPQGIAGRGGGFGARCGVARQGGKTPSFVLWRVSPRTPWGVSGGSVPGRAWGGTVGGGVGTGSGWCGCAWPWGQEGTSVTRPCPPGGGSEGGEQRGGSDAEVLQTRVPCERRGGRQHGGAEGEPGLGERRPSSPA